MVLKQLNFNEDTYFKVLLIFGIIATFYTNRVNNGQIVGLIGGIAGVFNIYLTANRTKYFIIASIIWDICFMKIAFQSALVYDVLQYIYFILMQGIQYKQWTQQLSSEGDKNFLIQKLSQKQRIQLFSALATIIIILGFTMSQIYEEDPYPYMDALNSVLGCVGTYMIAFRWYESMVLFTVSNLTCGITYFLLKQYTVWITMSVYFFYSSMCLYTWDKQYYLQQFNTQQYHNMEELSNLDQEKIVQNGIELEQIKKQHQEQ